MNKTFKYILSSLLVAGSLVACSPEEFGGVNENDIPEASKYADLVNITVDQSINQVTFQIGAKEVYGVWTIDTGKKEIKKTGSEFSQIFTSAGDYTVNVQVANSNGVSDGSVTKTFHIDNSIVDFSKYTTMLSKADWHMANKEKGHLACGESGTDGTNWWSGDPDCKANEGVYDNILTFTADFKYTFNPGDHGTIYVNKGVTIWPDDRNPDEDFNVKVSKQESEYGLEVDGDDLYLTFPKGTYFPYIANDYIWETPRYKVVNITTKKMTLLIDEPGVIAWQYILTTENTVEKAFTGFTYDQPDNIWKNIEVSAGGIYYADGGWAPYPDNGGATFNVTNAETKVVLPLATASQWQAQFPIHTNVGPGNANMSSAKHYDFSCVITSNKDLNGMTLKLVETGDNGVPGSLGIAYDENAVFYDNSTNLKAYEDYVFYLVDQPGVDIQDNLLQLVLDFGGNAEETEVTIKNIVLIEHDKNTELGNLPGNDDPDTPEPAVKDWNSDSPANLWKAVEDGSAFISVTPWFSGPGWGGGLEPEWEHEKGVWTVKMPEGMGGDQWMGQFPINTTLTASMDKKYNFYCVLEADADCQGVTIKLTETDDADGTKHDGNFFVADRHNIEMSVPYIYKATGVTLPQNDAHALSLFFDFGGTPVGTTVKISEIYFEEVKEVNYDDPNNMWKAVDNGDAFISVTPWFSGPGWGGGLNPEWSHDTGSSEWTVTIPEGIGGDQWMGQFPINTTLTAEMAATYSYSVTLEADADCPGVTIKLTQTDEADGTKHDDNFFFADRHVVPAFEEWTYTVTGVSLPKNDAHALSMFFDFGGTAAGTTVKIKKITLIKD